MLSEPCRRARGEARLVRHPVCPLRVYREYNEVADSGDVVIQKRGFSIIDTHESGIAIHLSLWFQMVNAYSHRNKIFLFGRHRGGRRFLSPGLHHIHHVSQ